MLLRNNPPLLTDTGTLTRVPAWECELYRGENLGYKPEHPRGRLLRFPNVSSLRPNAGELQVLSRQFTALQATNDGFYNTMRFWSRRNGWRGDLPKGVVRLHPSTCRSELETGLGYERLFAREIVRRLPGLTREEYRDRVGASGGFVFRGTLLRRLGLEFDKNGVVKILRLDRDPRTRNLDLSYRGNPLKDYANINDSDYEYEDDELPAPDPELPFTVTGNEGDAHDIARNGVYSDEEHDRFDAVLIGVPYQEALPHLIKTPNYRSGPMPDSNLRASALMLIPGVELFRAQPD